MRLEHLRIEQATGAVLVHNVVDAEGHKVLPKGRLLDAEDLNKLRGLGRDTVYAAVLESGDVREDDAAARIARRVAGDRLEMSKPSAGRVNFYATRRGLFSIDTAALGRFNRLPGLTLATIPPFTPVAPKKMVATLKTIGLALPEDRVHEAENIAGEAAPLFDVAPIARGRVALILASSENGRERVRQVFSPPIHGRIHDLDAQIVREESVLEEEEAIARAIEAALQDASAQMVILAGETSIMDAEDTVPRGIRRAGGEIELYGAPVEPGNLLLLAYSGTIPIIGAPGCVKSRETNVVDLILPRLLAGERVSRDDVIALGVGGLLVG